MPYLDGLQLARELRKASCRTKIIMLTMHNEPDFISAALDEGVLGYVFKARLSLDLMSAVDAVLSGNTFVSGPCVIKDSYRACRAAVVVAADRWPSTFMTALLGVWILRLQRLNIPTTGSFTMGRVLLKN
jgi:DNA-binding NarL/FixJ family response regulator